MSDSPAATPTPDYAELAKFLFKPFLDHPETLRIDVEFSPVRQKVLIRVAFGDEDKGRAFGRGGRNITAIRTAIEGVAQAAGHTAHVEVFGAPANSGSGASEARPARQDARQYGSGARPEGGLPKPAPKRKVID
jgi:uncharacterized protein